MNFKQLVEGITPDIYEGLKRGVEIGKWPDGRSLTEEQKILCMQAIILYEAKHLPEQERVGFDLSASCKSKASTEQAQTISLVPGTSSADSEGSKV